MSDVEYDLFVIGAGSGGVRAARLAAEAGLQVGIAESHRPGGTCVIRGCVPKKLMVYASEFSSLLKAASGFGWKFGEARYNHRVFLPRLHKEIARLSDIYAQNLERAGAQLFRERAEITGPNTLKLKRSGRKITARRILIATGGTPKRPEGIKGADLALTSDQIFDVKAWPDSALILGGGYIAVEFAGILNGMGVKTTLAYRGNPILRGFDMDLRSRVQDSLKAQGVEVWNGATPVRIKASGRRRKVEFADGQIRDFGLVMMALGRDAATQGLGLEQAGVELAADGSIPVDEQSRTNVESIWAVGDVTNRVNLTPVAIREAEAFARTEFYNDPQIFSHETIPCAVFSQPALASVGLSEEEARDKTDICVYRSDFRPMREALAQTGLTIFIKLIVERDSDKILGCHLIAPEAPEIIQLVAIALNMGATKADFDRTCAVHPTLAEELVTLKNPA